MFSECVGCSSEEGTQPEFQVIKRHGDFPSGKVFASTDEKLFRARDRNASEQRNRLKFLNTGLGPKLVESGVDEEGYFYTTTKSLKREGYEPLNEHYWENEQEKKGFEESLRNIYETLGEWSDYLNENNYMIKIEHSGAVKIKMIEAGNFIGKALSADAMASTFLNRHRKFKPKKSRYKL